MTTLVLLTSRTPWRAVRLLGALVLVATACTSADNAAASGAQVETMLVGPENIAVIRAEQIRTGPTVSGSLAPQKSATLRAEMSGAVLQTYAEPGQSVRAGQPLAQLDATVLRDQSLSVRAAVATASSSHDLARRDLQRSEALEKAGALPQATVERSRNQVLGAHAQLSTARAQLANVQQMLNKSSVRAPFRGVVAQRQVNAGDVVSPGVALFTIVDPGSMQLEASVPAEALSQVRVGMALEFRVNGYPDRTFSGRIIRVNPIADPVTRQVRIIAAIPNAGNTLVGGLFAEGRVSTETKIAPMVQASAVDERGLRPAVIRLRNGRVEKVEVTLGVRDAAAERVEIASGLSPGDTVLLAAARGISPGTPVRISAPSDVSRRRP